jgi:hypothetical protein
VLTPAGGDRLVRETSRVFSRICASCNRGYTHRAHRESLIDFLVSLVGVFPTVCNYCNARGQRLRPLRLMVLLCTCTIGLGYIVWSGAQRAKPPATVAATVDETSPVVFVKPAAHRQGLPAKGEGTPLPDAPPNDYSAQLTH